MCACVLTHRTNYRKHISCCTLTCEEGYHSNYINNALVMQGFKILLVLPQKKKKEKSKHAFTNNKCNYLIL